MLSKDYPILGSTYSTATRQQDRPARPAEFRKMMCNKVAGVLHKARACRALIGS
jgi:hypothetical protein